MKSSPSAGTAARWAVVALAVALAAPAAAKHPEVASPCPDGQFRVAGVTLMDRHAPQTGDMIAIEGTQVAVQSGCGSTAFVVRSTPVGPMLVARWKRCRSAGGKVRVRAVFSSDCQELVGKVVRGKKRQRVAFDAHRDGAPRPAGSFGIIAERIFARRGCTASSCHGASAQNGLDLRGEAAYSNLVGVPATNPAAAAAGALRVVPGKASQSFLSRKVRGLLREGEGARMPLASAELSVLERDAIDIWINAGAPASGEVAGMPHLTPEGYQPAEPPPVPPGGIQLLLDGPMLQPGEEIEGCLWVPAPNANNILISRTEVVANPGTHHVVVWRYTAPGRPLTDVWRPGDVACLNSGASLGSTGLAGAGMGNGANVGLPPGIASVLPGGGYFGLNAHYYNEFDVPIQVKVWFNFFPYEGTPEHIVDSLTSLDTTFLISVPPFQQVTRHGRFVNDRGRPMHFFQVGGHMHKRGLRFSAFHSDGTKIFDDYDWSHPVGRPFDPPFVLAPGDWFDYECLHDNGVERPVRRNQRGDPVTLTFGVSAEDEMCILTGSFYSD